MKTAYGPKRSKSFGNKYLALGLIVAALFTGQIASAQFNSTDSLHRYNNLNIRNSAVQAFTNLRLNTLLHGMIDWIDSARAGEGGAIGMDTAYAINDTTVRYRKNGLFYTFINKGIYDARRKVDSAFMINDTIMRFLINGTNRDVLVRGASYARVLNDSTISIGGDTINIGQGSSFTSSFIYPEDFGAVGDGVADDSQPFQDMWDFIAGGTNLVYSIQHKHRKYLINDTVILPKTITGGSSLIRIKWDCNGVLYTKTTTGPMFYRRPASQSEALNNMIAAYQLTIDGMKIQGDGTAGQVGLDLSALYTPIINGSHFISLDTGVVATFWLNPQITNNHFTNCRSIAFKGASGDGYWSSATTSNSAFNMPRFSGNQIGNYGGAFAGVYLLACDGLLMDGHISEGGNPRYDLYIESQGSTVVNVVSLKNIWFESTGGTYATNTCMYLRINGTVVIDNIQNDYADTLIKISPSTTAGKIIAKNWAYINTGSAGQDLFDGNGVLSAGIQLELGDMLSTVSDVFFDSTRWVGGVVGGAVAGNMFFLDQSFGIRASVPIKLDAGAFNTINTYSGVNIIGGKTFRFYEGTDITTNYNRFEILQSGTTTAFNISNAGTGSTGIYSWLMNGVTKEQIDPSNHYFHLGLLPNSDNTRSIGSSSLRFSTLRLGTGGLYVDTTAALNFGATPDVKIIRDSVGQLGIYNSVAAAYANVKAARYIATDHSGYNTEFSLASMDANEWITKQHLTDALAAATANIEYSTQFSETAGTIINPIAIDTVTFIATKPDIDTLHTRADSIVTAIAGLSNGVDSITRVAGIDSFRVWNSGAYTPIKDSIGAGGGGDDWGAAVVEHDGTLTGDGTVATPLKVDTSSGKIATKTDVKTYTTTVGAGLSLTETTDGLGNKTYNIINTGSPGVNPLNALDVRNYGWVSDVVVPGSGSTVTGTDNKIALQNMINALSDGQWGIIPTSGLIATALDTIKGPKRVHLLFLNTIYTNGNDIFRIANASGSYEQHTILFTGNIVGRVNMESHTKTTHDAGTQPPWGSFTGVPVKLINVNQSYIQFNRVEGVKVPCEIISFGGLGAQENTICWRWFYKNAYGVLQTCLDGSGYIDKNWYGGINGGTARVSGGLALKIDGYSGAAYNGEVYNGAFRSNQFHFLIENVDSIAVCNGDITEPWFDFNIEGGVSTGVLGSDPFKMRIASPNYVRSPTYTGRGVYDITRLGTGSTGSMGVNGWIDVPLWSAAGTFYGKRSEIDGSGNIIVRCPASLSQTARAAAPGYVRFLNEGEARTTVSISASTYTVASGVSDVFYNHTAGTLTLPSASSWPTREITAYNTNVNPLTVSNVVSGGAAVVLGGKSLTYFSNGTSWYPKGDGVGNAGSLGVCHKVTDANVTVDPNDYSVIVYNMSTDRTITMPDPAAFPNRVLVIVQSDGNGHTLNLSRSWTDDGATSTVILNDNKVILHSDGTVWQALMTKL